MTLFYNYLHLDGSDGTPQSKAGQPVDGATESGDSSDVVSGESQNRADEDMSEEVYL